MASNEDCNLPAVRYRFDSLADRYDKKQETAKCFATQYIVDAFDHHSGNRGTHGQLDVLDLGCGTGVCGQSFRPHAKRLNGVDVSEQMLDKARSLKIYDQLHLDDIQSYLGKTSQRYDLITLASVFLYFSNIQSVLDGCYAVLRSGGLVIFTADRHDDTDIDVQQNPRNNLMFTHSRKYLERCVHSAKLALLAVEEIDERLAWKDLAPVPAFVVTCMRKE